MQLLASWQHNGPPLNHMPPPQELAEEASALASAAAAERAELHTELAAARQALSDAQAASDARVQVLPRFLMCIVLAVLSLQLPEPCGSGHLFRHRAGSLAEQCTKALPDVLGLRHHSQQLAWGRLAWTADHTLRSPRLR